MATNPGDGGNPYEPTQPGESEESCEENPDQDHCPPPCYCEKLQEWGYLCCIFDCPGMSDFKDFIIGDAIGVAHAPPVPSLPAPSIPNIFDVLNGVDERNPAKPTGTEDPQLGNSSFDANDIMNNAPVIQEREDPTGGFNIVNPLDTLDENLSDPPKPQEELETLQYPGGSGNANEGNPSSNKTQVETPGNPGGQAKPPTTEGQAKPPTTGEEIKYPGT